MAKRPGGLIYWVNEKPPAFELAVLAVQHIFLMSSTLVLPVVLVTEIGGGFDQVRAVVALTMIACGLGTIVQAMRWRGIGSGFLCPNLCGPNFFGASVEAAWLGGLPLMRGMTIAAGVVEALFARVVHRLGFLFPPEITGLVVLMVAAGVIPLGASKFLGINYAGEPIRGVNLMAATLTLLVMVGINVWGKGKLKLYGVLVGMAFGYLICFFLGLISSVQFHDVMAVGWVAVPQFDGMWQFALRWSPLPYWTIVSICGALKSFGNLILCEKINDAGWSRPDIRRIGHGLMGDAIAVTASGVFGGVASDTSASNVALSNATGATSRWIGFGAGGLFILLGFSPKLSAVLSIMPAPVMGAIIVFLASFMIVSSLQIILSSKPDARKTFVIGIPLIFGLSLQALPELYAQIVPWLRPLFGSALTLATVLAVMLNLLLRIGGAKQGEASTTSAEG